MLHGLREAIPQLEDILWSQFPIQIAFSLNIESMEVID